MDLYLLSSTSSWLRAGGLLLGALWTPAGVAQSVAAGQAPGHTAATTLAPDSITPAEAVRFLNQATFGANKDEIARVRELGYEGWIDDQFAQPPSKQENYLQMLQNGGTYPTMEHRFRIWWWNSVRGPDQLRQRVAWALSQILVISEDNANLQGTALGMGGYYDDLTNGAFGNYRDLLGTVTINPLMGRWLTFIENEPADPALNITPDENFARELMQLFTIGLVQLDIDGEPLLDGFGAPIPTYDQNDIDELARVFTGWNFANATVWESPQPNYLDMENWPAYHDADSKSLLGGQVIPAGLTGQEDLDAALDIVFAHANVGPFIAKQLIKRLVTSNPTPGYVARVAQRFNDDGIGQRGNLGAVVKAILLDPEARNGHRVWPSTFGKLKEPLLRHAQFWRMFEALPVPVLGYEVPDMTLDYGQAPLASPTVFNFYTQFYAPPGPVVAAGLVAPEFQITTHTTAVATVNRFHELTFDGYVGSPTATPDMALVQIDAEKALAASPGALVDRLDLLLLGGQMSNAMRAVLVDYAENTPMGDGTQRVVETLYLILASPEYAVQR